MTEVEIAIAWIDEKHAAGAKQIGVTHSIPSRLVTVIADEKWLSVQVRSMSPEAVRDVIHDYIAALPNRNSEAL